MKKLIKVEKLTEEKYLNLFNATYNHQGKELVWTYASRRDYENLSIKGNKKTDAVMILPYFYDNNKLFVVVIKEFRSSINNYTYSLPAGIVEKDEDTKITAIRETSEEIGASVLNLFKTQKSSLTSAGLTDEELECFEAEIALDGIQNLDECEDINLKIISFDDIIDFVDKNEFCLPAALQLKLFYYKTKFNISNNK